MQALSESRSLLQLARSFQQRKRWESENPEIAAAWSEAMLEDEARENSKLVAARLAEAALKMPQLLRRCGVPGFLADNAVRRDGAAFAHVDVWLGSKLPVLLFMGRPGNGKTTAAVYALAQRLAQYSLRPKSTGDEREDGAFILAPALTGLSLFGGDKSIYSQVMFSRCVIIDDLGTENLNDFAMSKLNEVLVERISCRRATILTSNLEPAAFKQRYGERITDRLRESAHIAVIKEQSMRKASARLAVERSGVGPGLDMAGKDVAS